VEGRGEIKMDREAVAMERCEGEEVSEAEYGLGEA